MPDKPGKPPTQNAADIAREAFRQLATRRIAPTPEAYRDIYNEIAGIVDAPVSAPVANPVANPVASLSSPPTSATPLSSATPDKENALLRDFLNRTLHGAVASLLKGNGELAVESKAIGKAIREAKSAGAMDDAGTRLKQLCFKIETTTIDIVPGTATPSKPIRPPLHTLAPASLEDQQLNLLRDLLTRTLTLAVTSLLQGAPDLAQESEAIGTAIPQARSAEALVDIGTRLKKLCFKIELKSGDMAEQQELLLRLFKLLLENVSELVDEGSWLSGQIAVVRNLLAGPISHSALKDATRSLKEVIYKQGVLKHSLGETKVTVRNMMITFIDRLAAVATTTGDYHQKIDLYSKKISQANDISELNSILDDVMRETRITQNEALRSRDEMISARKDIQDAEARIHDLESKLEQMSELVREDQLTGSLNRRGLDDVFERELARSDRRASPLCVAMLDLDDFKRLNDAHGHLAGDQVLIHLVRVIKDTLRTMDVIARFGGEEFLIVLPDTDVADAMQTVTRLQRELTKQIFMHNNERVLLTFSAGVALRKPNEDQVSMVERADEALYKAKREGKNRVVAAD